MQGQELQSKADRERSRKILLEEKRQSGIEVMDFTLEKLQVAEYCWGKSQKEADWRWFVACADAFSSAASRAEPSCATDGFRACGGAFRQYRAEGNSEQSISSSE